MNTIALMYLLTLEIVNPINSEPRGWPRIVIAEHATREACEMQAYNEGLLTITKHGRWGAFTCEEQVDIERFERELETDLAAGRKAFEQR